MTTKILAIGDIHIRLKTLGKTREMTEKVVSVVDEQKPDIVVLLGDLLHTHNVVVALGFVIRFYILGVVDVRSYDF